MSGTTKAFDVTAWLAGTDRVVRRDAEGGKIRSVVVRRRFAAPIDAVWTAWVAGWTTKIADGKAAVGETVILDLGQPQRTTSKILVCDAPTRLAATWTYGPPPADIKPDEVEVRLQRHDDGTLVELEHWSESGAPWAGGVGAGWESGLMIFEVMMGGGSMADIPGDVAFPKMDEMWTELVASGTWRQSLRRSDGPTRCAASATSR